MARKINNCLFGLTFICSLISLHFVMVNLYYGRKEINRASDWSNYDYLGIDGEFAPFPIHCSTCALIGMSGHLLNSTLGKEIDDDHLCVFRLGFSPTKGFEPHVGSRTTVRIVDSFRFYPFLKKPWKLVTGPYKSDIWVLFDRQTGDISRLHGPVLRDLTEKMGSRFLWISRRAEREVLESLSEANQNNGLKGISAFWFATKIMNDAKCENLDVYGIPDFRICKRSLNHTLPSLYWENASTPLCVNGQDASFRMNGSEAPMLLLPTLAERRAFPAWSRNHLSEIRFKSPTWPS